MRIRRRTHRVTIGMMALLACVASVKGFTLSEPLVDRLVLVSPFLMFLLPCLGYLCGWSWCRYCVGLVSAALVLGWTILPACQHAIDREFPFWLIWAIFECVGVLVTAFCFAPLEDANVSTH
jgi:hypothetical protein